MTNDEILDFCLTKPGAYIDYPFGEIPVCVKAGKRIFAQLYPKPEDHKLTLNCDPMTADFYRNLYPGIVTRGYHCPPMLQPHFNTMPLNGSVPDDMLIEMIDRSYSTVKAKLPKSIQKELDSSDYADPV